MQELTQGERLLQQALKGVGDEHCYRLFRMNITLCLHRAVKPEEEAGLPKTWPAAIGGMAGGPVRVLRARNVPNPVAGEACQQMGREIIIPSRPDLWLPSDCGECPPCQARATIAAALECQAAAQGVAA